MLVSGHAEAYDKGVVDRDVYIVEVEVITFE